MEALARHGQVAQHVDSLRECCANCGGGVTKRGNQVRTRNMRNLVSTLEKVGDDGRKILRYFCRDRKVCRERWKACETALLA